VSTQQRRITKQLTCPACGDIVATAVHTRWPGNLVLTSTDGARLQPESVALQIRMAQQEQAAGGAVGVDARDRLEFLRRHVDELVYALRCRRGHATLRTAPQIVRAMRRTAGAWVPLDAT
jgi:hypothetical protein